MALPCLAGEYNLVAHAFGYSETGKQLSDYNESEAAKDIIWLYLAENKKIMLNSIY